VTDGVFSSHFTAEAPLFVRGSAGAPQKGKYTASISPGSIDTPQGFGCAVVTVSNLGAARINGTLSDGAKFSAGSSLGPSGKLPIFTFLYGRRGNLSGEVVFRETVEVSDADANLTWKRPAKADSALQLQAARYVYQSGTPLLTGLSTTGNHAKVSVTSAEMTNAIVDRPLMFSTAHQALFTLSPNPERLRLGINAKAGVFGGSFLKEGVTVPIRGVLYQKGGGEGIGGFKSASQSGRVTLVPGN
jgi:hypothetical protein